MIVRRTTTSDKRRRRGPSARTVLKDVTTYVSGWALIWQQALQDKPPSWPILALVAVLLGVPGASEVFSRMSGTEQSDSGSHSGHSSPSSSSSSSSDGDA